MIEKENNKLSPIINNPKNENFREKIKNYYLLFLKLEVKKVKIFKKQLKNLKMMRTTNFIIY